MFCKSVKRSFHEGTKENSVLMSYGWEDTLIVVTPPCQNAKT